MSRTCLFLCAIASCLVFALPASAALFEDAFSGTGALDSSAWTVTISHASVSVQQASGWAAFAITSGAGSSDGATAMTQDAWAPGSSLTLTWEVKFKSAGTGTPEVWPFLFTSDAGNLKVYLRFDSGTAAALYVDAYYALKNGSNQSILLSSGNTYEQTLTVTIDDTDVSATLHATNNGTTYDDYSKTLTHGLALTGVWSHDAANFGMRVENGTTNESKTVSFDYAILTPEPATLGLMATGFVAFIALRRRRR